MRPDDNPEGLRQSMSWLHTWTGLLLGWILFAMFLTGTLAFFKPEITRWMQPELRANAATPEQALATAERVLRERGAEASRWTITLPDVRQPTLQVVWTSQQAGEGGGPVRRGFQRLLLDPLTGETLQARETRGGDFFYRFHFELELPRPWGRWLACIAGMFMLVAIISGVITHKKIFTDFFTFRPAKGGQRAWMDGHNALSVLGLPFHFMITLSGVVIFVAMVMPAGIDAAYGNDTRAYTEEAYPGAGVAAPRSTGQPGVLAPLGPMLAQARAHWPDGQVGRIAVNGPASADATVYVSRHMGDRIAYGRATPALVFEGGTGRLAKEMGQSGPAAQTLGVLIGLHLGLFAEPFLRWVYFLVSLAGTAMVGTGLVLWVKKRRQKHAKAAVTPFSLKLVEGLNVASIAGLCAAVGAFFWANRLLPVDLPQHGLWEGRVFLGVWGVALVHAYLRPRRAWREQLWLGAILLGGVPLLNALTSDRHLGVSLPAGDWVMAGFDLTALASGVFLAWLAGRTGRPAAAPVPKAGLAATALATAQEGRP
ncbi:PepSY-associated TM helix domain-containing protein [Orrella dioscoreae]|nr:PepSY-associated TM helix domain-containing protein [Orrella dioscoreae]